MEQIVVWLIRC